MARELENKKKDSDYDLQLDKIRQLRLDVQKQFEKQAHDRERKYLDLHKINWDKMVDFWQQKLLEDRRVQSEMRDLKINKVREGEEAMIYNDSVRNIMGQENMLEL